MSTDLSDPAVQIGRIPRDSAPSPVRRVWWKRVLFVAIALGIWFWTQALLGRRVPPAQGVGDAIHLWTASPHAYLLNHPRAANLLLIVSSAAIDAVGIFLLLASVFGRSLRPFLALVLLLILRQICQGLCALPPPEGMIWHSPGVPTLLVTYGVSTDLFFSGHTGVAVLGAIELARLGRRWLAVLGIAIAIGEAATVLVLRAHYTMDVFTGAVTAFCAAGVAAHCAPAIDRWLDRRRTEG